MNAGWGISPWKSSRFHPEIWWISPRFDLWNPPKIIKASVSAKTLQFDECRVGAMTKDFMKSTRFHPWNLVDFTFEIQQSSPRFHLWNPPKIIKASVFSKNSSVWWMQGGGLWPRISWNPHEIRWISPEIRRISCEIRRISWNPLKSGGFHEIRRISCEIERPLARNCNPMFHYVHQVIKSSMNKYIHD